MSKQKSTESVSNGILPNFRTATFENNFGGLLLKRKQRRSTRSGPCGFRFSLFPGQLYIMSWNNVLSPPVFTKRSLSIWFMLFIFIYQRKILVVEILVAIRQIIKAPPGNPSRVDERATMPSLNSVTKSTWQVKKTQYFPNLSTILRVGLWPSYVASTRSLIQRSFSLWVNLLQNLILQSLTNHFCVSITLSMYNITLSVLNN